MNSLTCSIIVRTFNEERHIGRLLDGIQKQRLPAGIDLEIIVVDSGSTDSTIAIASHMGASIISIEKENFSFGGALNNGCRQASGTILLFASAHIYPIYTDWIEKMIKPFLDKKVALVYGRQIGNDVTRFSEHQVFAKWFPIQSKPDQQTPFCNNANCAIRKDLWELQKYDEHLTGLEDLDWAQRIMVRGYKIIYKVDAVIVHVHEETYQKIKNRYMREAIALKQIMPKVHFDFCDFIKLFINNAISDCINALRSGIFIKEFKGIISFRYMQFRGTYLGHNQKGEVSKDLKNRFYYPIGIGQRHLDHLPEEHNKIDYN